MFLLRVECDAPGCPAHWQTAEPEGIGLPTLTSSRGEGWMFVVDTSWIDLPDGWEFATDNRVFCPEHAELAA